tara:strand:- start:298 stop:1161 length:864 start_codon:yes stop_codon:yes gene_type:complete
MLGLGSVLSAKPNMSKRPGSVVTNGENADHINSAPSCIAIPDVGDIFRDNYTLSFWFKAINADFEAGSATSLFGWQGAKSTRMRISASLRKGRDNNDITLQFSQSSGLGFISFTGDVENFTDADNREGIWHQLTICMRRSFLTQLGNFRSCQVYLDGTPLSCRSNMTDAHLANYHQAPALTFGNINFSEGGENSFGSQNGTGRAFKFANIAIWNNDLSDNICANDLYRNGSGVNAEHKYKEYLVRYYKMNEGSKEILKCSVGGADATIYNARWDVDNPQTSKGKLRG